MYLIFHLMADSHLCNLNCDQNTSFFLKLIGINYSHDQISFSCKRSKFLYLDNKIPENAKLDSIGVLFTKR